MLGAGKSHRMNDGCRQERLCAAEDEFLQSLYWTCLILRIWPWSVIALENTGWLGHPLMCQNNCYSRVPKGERGFTGLQRQCPFAGPSVMSWKMKLLPAQTKKVQDRASGYTQAVDLTREDHCGVSELAHAPLVYLTGSYGTVKRNNLRAPNQFRMCSSWNL